MLFMRNTKGINAFTESRGCNYFVRGQSECDSCDRRKLPGLSPFERLWRKFKNVKLSSIQPWIRMLCCSRLTAGLGTG